LKEFLCCEFDTSVKRPVLPIIEAIVSCLGHPRS
jgi:hypothetical protein